MLITHPHWRKIEKPLFPWVRTVERIFASCELPCLSGPTIALMSDYGGEHRTSRYDVISILVLDSENTGQWEYMRREIRHSSLKDSRRMSFKNLGDYRRKQALEPFLLAANSITGVCASFAIHKEVKFLCTNPKQFGELTQQLNLEGGWNAKTLDHMIRLVHFISLLIAGLSQPNQNIYWISDEGSFFANTPRCQDVNRLASYFTSYYVKHQLGELGIGTTQIDEDNLRLEDLTAIPDLVAGTVADLSTRIAATYGRHIPDGLALLLPTKFPPKVQVLVDWLTDDTQRLKRPIVVFDLTETHQLRVYRRRLA
jgi:hypothetical protein